jgi:hypothetical protein
MNGGTGTASATDRRSRTWVPDNLEASPATRAQCRLVTRYATRAAEAADDNQRRAEAVFAELASTGPGNVSYLVLRLADDSFVHIAFHGHAPGESNPIVTTDAFALRRRAGRATPGRG